MCSIVQHLLLAQLLPESKTANILICLGTRAPPPTLPAPTPSTLASAPSCTARPWPTGTTRCGTSCSSATSTETTPTRRAPSWEPWDAQRTPRDWTSESFHSIILGRQSVSSTKLVFLPCNGVDVHEFVVCIPTFEDWAAWTLSATSTVLIEP